MKLNTWFKFACIAICVLQLSSCEKENAEVEITSKKIVEKTAVEYIVNTTTKNEIFAVTTTRTDIESESIDKIIGMDGVLIDRPLEQKKQGATFDTFTFYREPTGLVFNDDLYRDYKSEWKKVVPGDVFGSLVVSSVSAIYDPVAAQFTEDHSLKEYSAWGLRRMSFDGNITLNGILYSVADEQAFWGKCLFFQPTSKSLADNNFPTLRPISLCLSSDPYYKADTYEDTQGFYVGNIDDFADAIDWSAYADENNIIEIYAEVVLSNIEISYNTSTGASNLGKAIITKIIRIGDHDN